MINECIVFNTDENTNKETLFTSTKNTISKILTKANALKTQYRPLIQRYSSSILPGGKKIL